MFERYSRSGLALMAAPLYAGPVLAGWSAAPPLTIAAFAALFFLMQLLLGRAAAKTTVLQVGALSFLALVQLILATLVFAVGAGLAWISAPIRLPLWLPLALSIFGACLGAWRYRGMPDEAAMSEVLDQAIQSVETGLSPQDDHQDRAHEAALQEALSALYALPETANIADIDPIVQRLERLGDDLAYAVLLAEINEGFRNVDLAMLRYLASPRVRDELSQSADLGFALDELLSSDDTMVVSELVALTETLLDENAPAHALPPAESLIKKAGQFPALTPLIARVQKEHDTWQAQDR